MIIIYFICLGIITGVFLAQIKVSSHYKELAEINERLYNELAKQRDEEDANSIFVTAEYYTSESDSIKYRSDKSMVNAIKNRLAMNIGDTILKKYEPNVSSRPEGKKLYSIVVKVRKI